MQSYTTSLGPVRKFQRERVVRLDSLQARDHDSVAARGGDDGLAVGNLAAGEDDLPMKRM